MFNGNCPVNLFTQILMSVRPVSTTVVQSLSVKTHRGRSVVSLRSSVVPALSRMPSAAALVSSVLQQLLTTGDLGTGSATIFRLFNQLLDGGILIGPNGYLWGWENGSSWFWWPLTFYLNESCWENPNEEHMLISIWHLNVFGGTLTFALGPLFGPNIYLYTRNNTMKHIYWTQWCSLKGWTLSISDTLWTS